MLIQKYVIKLKYIFPFQTLCQYYNAMYNALPPKYYS